MSQVIAGLYEIQEKIGAGGGGIVYLGRHLRLNKQIVLKADKRTLNSDQEELRREVDMLKELSHTYIPQVYDFVQQDGVVYTVMDYIEGESLDKVLGRGIIPRQPQVIQWACQLLKALCYLHGRPPHGILHGDIKPANIMLRPNGDICLIDYNIALALGEDGAVKVGFSRGYASPEHYGIDYAGEKENINTSGREKNFCLQADSLEGTEILSGNGGAEKTECLMKSADMKKTQILQEYSKPVEREGFQHIITGNTSAQHTALLDVRSDIYSLGATLYHLLSGWRPNPSATGVEPLGIKECSPQISEIIQKAMAPNPDMRYQSAQEMLDAFQQLHKKDVRVIHHKRHMAATALLTAVLSIVGSVCIITGTKQLEKLQESLTLAEYSANSLEKGDVSEAIRLALQAADVESGGSVPAQVQKVLTDALGVYDLSDGYKRIDALSLPSAPFSITMSPGGSYIAAVCQQELIIFSTETRKRIASFPMENSALADVVFLNESYLIYAGNQGVTAYDLAAEKRLWTGETATAIAVSGDNSVVAAVNRDADYAVLYQASDGTQWKICSFEGNHMAVAANDIFANPKDGIFCLNEEGNLLAVSFDDGSLKIFDLDNSDNTMILYEGAAYEYFEGGFCRNYFAFAANKSDESVFGLVDVKEGVYMGSLESRDDFLVRTDKKGIYLSDGNLLVRFDPDILEEEELAYTGDMKITAFAVEMPYSMVVTEDGKTAFYDGGANRISQEDVGEEYTLTVMAGEYGTAANRSNPSISLFRRENHDEAQLLSYDAGYVHDEARISGDGKTAMLFSYQGFRIYDMSGNLLLETELPDAEQIYDQQFRREDGESWLEVIWYDGTVRRYAASDGTLLSEERQEPPSKDLYEEFYTERYRVTSSLHGTPEVYDVSSGQKVGELEEDAYLTYVTQTGDYIITEYVTAEGVRYGYLLNENLQKLAYLPNLCEAVNGMLIFDYGSGNLRQCRLYSLQELAELGESYIREYQRKGELTQ